MVERPSKQGLPCPICQVDLVMSDRQGIEIDYCPQCRGVWLDRGELDKIIERSAAKTASYSPRDGDFERGREGHRGGYGHGDHKRRRRKSFFEELFD
ncbi:zf-TFIIB domain-containing protein [Tsuneonella sp. CC-YZS046]|uniref:TFIIB-type zinc ribbon-containing protein n=1 Tax=Tsuneonella sp. CC-YZS046 TaxID=3042152 RepID=UPI002D770D53|nr:zf-TFIIB domain-containing protein [Tsuneonella sp. CC-YZS046]WRO66191.1 zf-TFIIB domain-containing protein [Tsuneonella sp. CC-YZS046]